MCAVSMIMDHGYDTLRQWTLPNTTPFMPTPIEPNVTIVTNPIPPIPSPDELARFIKQFEGLLEKARQYDLDHGQPDCELDEKRLALKKIADEMGVTINFPVPE